MAIAPEALLEQALALSPRERAKLATGLLASLDESPADETEVERLWSAETDRRAAEIASGTAQLTTWEHVLDRVDGTRTPPAE